MMTADGYGNAGAYFNNLANVMTAYYLSLYNFQPGKRPGSVYSVIRQQGVAIGTENRIDAAAGAIAARQGMRAVAFPMHSGWGYDTPNT